jgi:hypothetical protein
MVVPRPRRLLRTRSRICAVSISKDYVRAGSMFQRPAPAHLTRHLLFAVIAYRIQADRFGDLEEADVRLPKEEVRVWTHTGSRAFDEWSLSCCKLLGSQNTLFPAHEEWLC